MNKKNQHHGSQFSRSKLQQDYNPRLRTFKKDLMSFISINQQERHNFIAKQQSQICDRAVQQLKNGKQLVIDWKTKTNFRSTKTKYLPRLFTEPNDLSIKKQIETPSSCSQLQSKRISLARLLHVRHRKNYLRTKKQLQHERQLFGQSESLERTLLLKNKSKSHNKSSRLAKNMQEAQESILKTVKLQILQEDLKNKFIEIRELYNRHRSHKPIQSQAPLKQLQQQIQLLGRSEPLQRSQPKNKKVKSLNKSSRVPKNLQQQQETKIEPVNIPILKQKLRKKFKELRELSSCLIDNKPVLSKVVF